MIVDPPRSVPGKAPRQARYVIRLFAEHSQRPQQASFKGAIRVDGAVHIANGQTPFEFDCSATVLLAMFEPLVSDERLRAELWSNRLGALQMLGSCTVRSVLIVEDHTGTTFSNSSIGG